MECRIRIHSARQRDWVCQESWLSRITLRRRTRSFCVSRLPHSTLLLFIYRSSRFRTVYMFSVWRTRAFSCLHAYVHIIINLSYTGVNVLRFFIKSLILEWLVSSNIAVMIRFWQRIFMVIYPYSSATAFSTHRRCLYVLEVCLNSCGFHFSSVETQSTSGTGAESYILNCLKL